MMECQQISSWHHQCPPPCLHHLKDHDSHHLRSSKNKHAITPSGCTKQLPCHLVPTTKTLLLITTFLLQRSCENVYFTFYKHMSVCTYWEGVREHTRLVWNSRWDAPTGRRLLCVRASRKTEAASGWCNFNNAISLPSLGMLWHVVEQKHAINKTGGEWASVSWMQLESPLSCIEEVSRMRITWQAPQKSISQCAKELFVSASVGI